MNSLDRALKNRLEGLKNGTISQEIIRRDLIRSGIMNESGEILIMVKE